MVSTSYTGGGKTWATDGSGIDGLLETYCYLARGWRLPLQTAQGAYSGITGGLTALGLRQVGTLSQTEECITGGKRAGWIRR